MFRPLKRDKNTFSNPIGMTFKFATTDDINVVLPYFWCNCFTSKSSLSLENISSLLKCDYILLRIGIAYTNVGNFSPLKTSVALANIRTIIHIPSIKDQFSSSIDGKDLFPNSRWPSDDKTISKKILIEVFNFINFCNIWNFEFRRVFTSKSKLKLCWIPFTLRIFEASLWQPLTFVQI